MPKLGESKYMEERHFLPKYLVIIFLGILALVGVGIWQKTTHRATPKVLGATSERSVPTRAPIVKFMNPPQPVADIKNPNLGAKNVILLDNATKNILYSQSQYDIVPIASLTKIMTAVLVLDHNKMDEVVTMTSEDVKVIGSNLGFVPGEQIKVIDLMRALLIQSSNEAANALARVTAGSVPAFAEQMNARAEEMNLNKTHYDDPHGLSAQSVSTAYEQAILFSYALNYPQFKEIIGTAQTTVTSVDGRVHTLKNSNRLITDEMRYDGMTGGKTGYTPEAGHCLATAATRNNHTIISVILNTASPLNTASAVETKKLLDWGFASYTWPLN